MGRGGCYGAGCVRECMATTCKYASLSMRLAAAIKEASWIWILACCMFVGFVGAAVRITCFERRGRGGHRVAVVVGAQGAQNGTVVSMVAVTKMDPNQGGAAGGGLASVRAILIATGASSGAAGGAGGVGGGVAVGQPMMLARALP